MTGIALLLLAGATSLTGCLALALSQPRNRRRVFGHGAGEAAPDWLRPSGWSLLGLSLLICLMSEGISFGAVLWPMTFAVSSLLTAGILAIIPGRIRAFVPTQKKAQTRD